MLADARSRIARYAPAEAVAAGVLLVDTRSQDERRRTGVIPGSIHVPLSVLPWRADPESRWSNPELAGRELVLACAEGHSSSLAAGRLRELGIAAGDLEGGFEAWLAAGLPVTPAPPERPGLPGMGGPDL